MATETADIRAKARRVKNHILTQYLKLSDRVDEKGLGDLSETEYNNYWKMTGEFAKNVVPRSQEVTGEDGEAIQVTLVKYAKPLEESSTQVDSGVRETVDEGIPPAQ